MLIAMNTRIFSDGVVMRKRCSLKIIVLLLAVWCIAAFIVRSCFLTSDRPWTSSIPIPFLLPYSKSNHVTTSFPRVETTRVHQCPFPVLDPFDPTIKKHLKTYPTLTCSNTTPGIVDVVGDKLTVNVEKVKAKLNKNTSVTNCKYRSISMKSGTDFVVHYGAWSKSFNNSIRLLQKDINLHVTCYDKSKLISVSYIALVKKKKETEKIRLKDYKKHVKKHSPKETLSVVLVGIDGTAKQNFIRTFPKTREFILKKLNAIEFHKFNKVGLNTFPNVLPLLTGLHDEEVKKRNWTYKMPFDKIDHLFLWNEYQKAGYRTSMVLDGARVTAFHYQKQGWKKPTFDFYPRPITIASEPDKVYRKGGPHCMGDIPEVTLLHDYWVKLIKVYNNTPSTPYFVYSFLVRLTHDDPNRASAGDELYLRLFQELVTSKVLNNTLLIFFSDHGPRFGTFRNTYNGLIEAKTPLLYFMFPPWFEKKYPDVMNVLRKNTQRLTTMFDVHATLKDLLVFKGKSQKVSPVDRGISFFSEIPENRTCKMAGIPVTYCACTTLSRENVTSVNITSHLVSKFVEHLVAQTRKYRGKCEILKHKDTKRILVMTPEIPLTNKNITLYHITVQTTPGDGVFEASVSFKSDTKAVSVLSGISRLNMYKGQAECIDSSIFRPFCYCSKKKKS